MPWTSEHIEWLVDTGERLKTADCKEVEVWEFRHDQDEAVLSAIGYETPSKIFTSVAAADTPPQYWGDTTLWAKINGLAAREPPLVRINGPTDRLPQWERDVSLSDFTIIALPNNRLVTDAGSNAVI